MNNATMDKPRPLSTRPLATFLGATLNDVFKRQGFASRELVTRWAEIVGTRVAAHAEPVKIQWPRAVGDAPPEPATLVLRVEGPVALEIQHSSDVIIARVNQFFGYHAYSVAQTGNIDTPSPLGDIALGPAAARVTIIEYASMTCPHCAAFTKETFPKLKATYIDTGKVRYVFREFPLDQLALLGAELARCIAKGDPVKFFGAIDVLFASQEEWANNA